MKIAGWICLVIGVLSFLGAAFKGNSVFGPIFWIGLGVFLLYRVNNKEQESEKETIEVDERPKEMIQVHESYIKSDSKNIKTDIQRYSSQQLECLKDIQTQLTLQ